ncbi:MAG: hypothetical protein ACOZBL_05760 [Patescibacteria group bacterium]
MSAVSGVQVLAVSQAAFTRIIIHQKSQIEIRNQVKIDEKSFLIIFYFDYS